MNWETQMTNKKSKIDEQKPAKNQDLEEIKALLVQMNQLLEKLLQCLPFPKN